MKWSASLVLLLLLAAHVGAQEKPERYVDSAVGFSFDVPQGWAVSDVPSEKFKVVHGPRLNGFTPNIATLDDEFEGPLKDYMALSQRHLEASYKQLGYEGVKLLRQAEFTTKAGLSGIKLTNEVKTFGKELVFAQYAFSGKGKTKLIFTCVSLAADFAVIEPICEASMKTLTIAK